MNGLEGLGFQVEEHRACVPVPPSAFTSDQVRVQRSRANALHSPPDGTGRIAMSRPCASPGSPFPSGACSVIEVARGRTMLENALAPRAMPGRKQAAAPGGTIVFTAALRT